MEIEIIKGTYRHHIANLLEKPENNRGVELGVANGIFSVRMMESKLFSFYVGVDAYAGDRGHNIKQYEQTFEKLNWRDNYLLLRLTFNKAIRLFADASLDFLYIDGYAHERVPKHLDILSAWYPKVKSGGVFAGDDYDTEKWENNAYAIRKFLEEKDYDTLYLTDITEGNTFCGCRSWGVVKK